LLKNMMNQIRPISRLAVVAGLCAMLVAAPVTATEWLMASAEPVVVPGQRFEVVVIGPGDAAQWPQRLAAHIELPANGARIAIELVAIGALEPEATQRRYFGRWPDEATGIVSLTLPDQPGARLLLEARDITQTAAIVADSSDAAPSIALATTDRSADPIAPTAASPAPTPAVSPSGLTFHEPMYFLIGGRDPVSARFQFSFKYRIFDDHGVIAETIPIARGLYFGFTQTSLWDLQGDSRPFRDSSFRPTFFYRWTVSDPADRGSMALSMGYEHESNGREDIPSRSIDTLFVGADARYHFEDGRTYLGIAPKFWTYLDREDNPDIARYRGYGELGVRFGRDDGLLLTSLIRRGTAGKMGAQMDLSYPLRRSVFSGVGAFVHLQAYKGYGETLLDYNVDRPTQFRIGVSLVR